MIKAAFILYYILAMHPVHVSLASIDYDAGTREFKMFLKVYSDDLENDCRIMKGDHDLLLYDNELMPDTAVIREYVNNRIVFEGGGRVLEGKIGRIESDAGEVRIFVTYNYSGNAGTFTIHNTIMTDLFDDQTNLLIFRMENFEEGFKFTSDNTEVTIKAGR